MHIRPSSEPQRNSQVPTPTCSNMKLKGGQQKTGLNMHYVCAQNKTCNNMEKVNLYATLILLTDIKSEWKNAHRKVHTETKGTQHKQQTAWLML